MHETASQLFIIKYSNLINTLMKLKHITFTIILFLAVNFTGVSQEYRIDTMYITHNDQRVMALKSAIEPDFNFVKKETLHFYSKHFRLSFKGKNELVAKEAFIPEISTKRMNYYVLIESDNYGTTIYNCAQFGFDIYIDTLDYKEEFNSMKMIFSDYLNFVLTSYYKLKIKNLRKEISKQNKENKRRTRKTKQLDKKIARNTKAIDKLTLKDNATDDEVLVVESKQLKLKSRIKEYNTQKQYNNQKLKITKENLNQLARELEKVNLKLQQLTSTKITP